MGIQVIWEVEDGYVGKSRPHTTFIPDDELEMCETEEEKEELIEDRVQEDFEQRIMWYEKERKRYDYL